MIDPLDFPEDEDGETEELEEGLEDETLFT